MITYKDRTFCNSPQCTNECGRKIEQQDWEAAEKLGLPIAIAYFCGEPLQAIKHTTH